MGEYRYEPLISVIVPVYNAEEYLERCVASVLGQTYRKTELILIDDGSKDKSGGMCDEYAKGPDVKVVHQENGGLTRAWRSGVKESSGEYLCFVDADDWITRDMLENLVRALDDSGRKQIAASNYVIDRADGSVPREMRHGITPGSYEGDELVTKIKKNILGNENRIIGMSRCMKLIHRDLITDNIGWTDVNVRMAEDVTIMLPAILDAERVVVLPGHYDYHYYYNPESMVHAYDATMTDSIHRVSAIIKAVLTKKYEELGITDVDINAMTQKEYQYLFTLLVKNELRKASGGEEDAVKLCLSRRMPERMRRYPAEAKDPANAAVFFFMKHPEVITATALKGMMRIKR